MAITNLKLKTAMSLLCILCTFVPFVLLIFGALVKPMEKPTTNGTAPDINGTAPVGVNVTSPTTSPPDNDTDAIDESCYRDDKECKDGVVIPSWKPRLKPESGLGHKVLRAVVYFLVMFFFFLGISVIADRFMAAIETITSQEKKVKVKMKNGEVSVRKVRIWNETVSNLTLMALGSSAPEILLAIIEVFGNKMNSGELGPGTIVGSAAFNLFVIIGICVYVIPEGETRRQKHLSVFFCTASWSIFAYIWLYLIIAVITPGRIHVWEAIVTFLFFPMLVLNAYLLDTQVILKKFLKHRYRTDRSFGNNTSTIIASSDVDHVDLPLKPLTTPNVIVDAASTATAAATAATPDINDNDDDDVTSAAATSAKAASEDAVVGSASSLMPLPPRATTTTKTTTKNSANDAVVDVDRFDSLDVGAFENSCYASSTAPASPAFASTAPVSPTPASPTPASLAHLVSSSPLPPQPGDDINVDDAKASTLFVRSPDLATATTTTTLTSASSSQSNVSSHPLTLAVISKNEISPQLESRRQTDFVANAPDQQLQQQQQLLQLQSRQLHQQQQFPQQQHVFDAANKSDIVDSLHHSPSCRKHRENGHVVMNSSHFQLSSKPHATSTTLDDDDESTDHPSPSAVTIDVVNSVTSPPPPPLAIVSPDGLHLNQFQFKKAQINVVESCGEVELEVVRKCPRSLPVGAKVRLGFRTVEGTAKFGKHFAKVSGFLVFEGEETTQSLRVGIIDECCYDKDLVFCVILENPTLITDFHCNGFNNGSCNGRVNANNHFPPPLHHHPSHPAFQHHHHPPAPIGTLNGCSSDSDHLPSVTISSGSPPDRLSGSPFVSDRLSGSPFASGSPLAPELIDSGFTETLDSLSTPSLGEIFSVNIRIRESKEYKSTVDKLLKRTNRMISTNTSSWRQQFVDAFKVLDDEEEDDDDDDNNVAGATRPPAREPSSWEYFVHFLSFFWKLLFATVPPTDLWNGWPCFCISIFWIGVLTAVVGDVASHVGCTIGMKDTVTAISFVALGTSVPDTFASKISAIQDEHADNSIGNVTGSNAVNVFLGVGIAWSIAAIYHHWWGTAFTVESGNLGFALTVFCICAFIAVGVLVARRSPKIANGELGGPFVFKFLTTALFIGMWFIYILLNGLESYCYIPFPK